jgi:hypothetical protein
VRLSPPPSRIAEVGAFVGDVADHSADLLGTAVPNATMLVEEENVSQDIDLVGVRIPRQSPHRVWHTHLGIISWPLGGWRISPIAVVPRASVAMRVATATAFVAML